MAFGENNVTSREEMEHLRLLSIFHYVVAGIIALCAMFPVIHLAIGIAMVTGMFDQIDPANPPPAFMGWFFVIFPAMMIVCGLAMSVLVAIAGRRLARRRSHTFCLVVAGLESMLMPFGTVLGVFTIIVLMKPSVKELFGVAEKMDESLS